MPAVYVGKMVFAPGLSAVPRNRFVNGINNFKEDIQ